jgi:hypothetical protein
MLIAVGMFWSNTPWAAAEKPFRAEFEAKYIRAESTDPKDIALKEAFEKAKCNVCHVGPKKKTLNAYGLQIGKLIGKGDKHDTEKIQAALEKVAEMKADPNDLGSPTFGELIRQGKLPAADTK